MTEEVSKKAFDNLNKPPTKPLSKKKKKRPLENNILAVVTTDDAKRIYAKF